MWAITLKQPYAWMVIHGPKDVENRGWWNKIVQELLDKREPFAIHAGERPTRRYYSDAVDFAREEDPELVVPDFADLVFGAILGTSVIWHRYEPVEWCPPRSPGHVRWHMEGQNGWALEHRTPLPAPIPWKGKQGFWQLDESVIGRAA